MNIDKPEMSMLSFANDCNERTRELEKLLQNENLPKHLIEKMEKSIKDMRKQSKILLKLNEQVDSSGIKPLMFR